MLTQPPKPDSTAAGLIRIVGTEILPQVQPTIAVGQILRVSVRSNQDGQGQLYLKGTLVPATLPPGLEVGERLLTEVTQADGQLVLKLLSRESTGQNSENLKGATNKTSIIQQQVATGLKESLAGARNSAQSINLQELLQSSKDILATNTKIAADNSETKILESKIERSAKSTLEALGKLPIADILSDVPALTTQLKQAAIGNLADPLRQAAATIRGLTVQPGSQGNEQLAELHRGLDHLLQQIIENNLDATTGIFKLIENFTKRLANRSTSTAEERNLIGKALADLKSSQEGKEDLTSSIAATLSDIEEQFKYGKIPKPSENSSQLAAFVRLADQLDELANTQQNLAHVNAAMQALGEPVMLLFPFLMSGFMGTSELAFDVPREKNRQGGEGYYDDSSLDDRPDTTRYQRIQISLPLPNIGNVGVELAFRGEEILLQLSIADSEVVSFLEEQLASLESILRGLNFSQIQMQTRLSANKTELPHWYLEILKPGAFIA